MNDDTAFATAEEFARELGEKAAEREHDLRRQEAIHRHGRVIAVIWAPVVMAVVVGLFVLIGFIVHTVTAEHAKQVKVWCYADPNSDRATSSFTGRPADVKGLCPDGSRS